MHPHPDEKSLLVKARQGDAPALEELYRHYVEAVYRYMFYRTGDTMVAEDLTAEVFASMLTSITRYRDYGVPFGAWLFRIARARLADYWRYAKRREKYQLPLEEELENIQGFASPEAHFQHGALLDALQYLTPAELEVILLRFGSGLSNQEIALVVRSNANAVKSKVFRALKKLRGILERKEEFNQEEGLI
ncbi:MAG: sigma-70 family RNA polymerase sigma factor [Anaerolineae bacterium]|nr:sigma-70 family RNA polymerase sigma factor [Anaerolineae bacterium]